ncbi:uncharacterized protein LOC117180045 [Belonocnema kinseyi]|uniref:uncharacterized protein LOC117180045 n=1 Tax=Belonocnema kinseyi TaxID=2817044 RepID=UPI00143DB95A|nr:uncharacterized protein LOC117180045 [Belonocnema kinseyi]
MPSHKIQNKQVQNQKSSRKSLKEALLKWICERHATNSPLDRKVLRQKALQISESLELPNFKCSDQWMTSFLKKYGFSTTLTNCTGPCFKDYRLWVDLMRTVLTQYKYKDLFHVDELTMYSGIMPLNLNSTSLENPAHSQIINAMNLISTLFCCNASGSDKLPPLISGPHKSNIFRDDCRYCYSANSLISDKVFEDWILSLNHIMSQQNRKILLLLHRQRIQALRNTELSNINLIFFPAEFPPHLRPLRRDVFHSAKMKYRLIYAENIIKPESKWGLEEVIDALLESWNEVPRELIVSSFQRTSFRSDDSLLEISCPNWEKLSTGISFKRFVTFDDYLSDVSSSMPNETKQLMIRKHNYNLRTNFQEVLLIDESDNIWKLKDKLKDLVTLAPGEGMESKSTENVNLNQEKDAHEEENFPNALHQDKYNEDSVCFQENIPKNLENNAPTDKASYDVGSVPSVSFTQTNRYFTNTLVLRAGKNHDLEQESRDGNGDELSQIDRIEERIDGHQTPEGGVDKQIDEERLDSLSMEQIEQLVKLNTDSNRSATSLGKRNNFTPDKDQTPEKVQRTNNNWSEQYRTKYVFGSNAQNMAGPSMQNIHLESIIDSQKKAENNKPTGSKYIFTKTGTARDPPCTSKE